MKKLITSGILATVLLLASCGSDSDKSKQRNLTEKFDIEVKSDLVDLSNVKFNKMKAFSFARSVGKDKNRRANVVIFSNQDIKLSDYHFYADIPEKGQYYIIVEYLGEILEGNEGFPKKLEAGDYNKLGTFEEGNTTAVFAYYVDENGDQQLILKQQSNPKGGGVLEKSSNKELAGSADISYDGFSLKANFSTPLHKDFWPKIKEQMINMRKLNNM